MSGLEGAFAVSEIHESHESWNGDGVLDVHVIPIQQLVLGAKGNFSVPELL